MEWGGERLNSIICRGVLISCDEVCVLGMCVLLQPTPQETGVLCTCIVSALTLQGSCWCQGARTRCGMGHMVGGLTPLFGHQCM